MLRKSPHALTLLMLMIAGCGSSPPVSYYGLDSIDIRYTQDPDGSPVLALGPFRMPAYLNRSQMVTRGSGAEMLVNDTNRWAEPLDDAIHNILAANVDSLMESLVVLAYPTALALEVDFRLAGRIIRFDSGQDGLIILEVQWGVADGDGKVLVVPRRDRYESHAAEPGDASAIARAMSDALAQFSRDISSEMESLKQPPASRE